MADRSPLAMLTKVTDDLPGKTGKTFGQWVKIAKKDGPDKQMACLKWLKESYGLKHNQALVIAAEAVGNSMLASYSDEGAMLDKMYSGKKEHLLQLHQAAEKMILGLGPGVAVRVCKTYVSYSRERQFTLIQPTTQKFVDIGLCMPTSTKPSAQLEPVKNLYGGERFNFRLRISEAQELEASGINKWLNAAWKHGVRGT